MRRAAALLLVSFALVPVVTEHGARAATVEQRIEEGLGADTLGSTVPQVLLPPSLDDPTTFGASLAGPDDASLVAPTGETGRLRTTLEPVDIEQRIDKGLTAAGERSAFPPDLAYGAFQRGWFLTAFSLALTRAEKSDAPAQTLLGVLLSRGLGVKQDLSAAADWFQLAGASGDREALYALGQLYLAGQGVAQDIKKAAEMFQRAADLGHAGAAREYGYLLLQGKGEAQNAMLAAAYLRRAARLGDMDAQYALAGLYAEGVGVVADDAHALRWFGEAARNGHVGAEVEYAIMLFNGRGTKPDPQSGAFWLKRAANSDNPVAQLRLARLLAEGDAIGEDKAEAARWYLIAKSRGMDDDAMEDFLKRLDTTTRETAEAAAAKWNGGRDRLQAAISPESGQSPVDNTVK